MMPSCEKCWADSRAAELHGGGQTYSELVKSRECTPEEQAGPDALRCPDCGRMTVHQVLRNWCMACRGAVAQHGMATPIGADQ